MSRPSALRPALLAWGILGFALVVRADEPVKVSYYREIRPILQEHCQGCHQPAKPMGGLVMTSFEALKKGGESAEPAFVAGKPDESTLVVQITPKDGQA